MPSAFKKAFYFHAHASSLGGSLETPHKKVVPSQASVALPAVGGHAVARTEAFNCDEIVSCRAAYTRVTGGLDKEDGSWFTLATSVVEGLNILETVKVERVVAQISIEHPADGGNPTFSLAGSHFDGIRLGGCDVSPTLNSKLLGIGIRGPDRVANLSTDWPRASCQNDTNCQSGEECPVGFKPIRLDDRCEAKGRRMCSLFVGGRHRSSGSRQSFWSCPGNPAFWKDPSRRVARLSIFDSALHGSRRARMRHKGTVERGYGDRFRWHLPAIGLVIWLLAAPAGCRSSSRADPTAIFQNTRSDFRPGNLDVALHKAEKAREDFSASGGDWAIKFRLLEAEILTDEGRRPEVIALLNSPGVTYPVSGDLAIKRNLLCGLAHARLGQEEQADKELQEAHRLSEKSNSSLSGEVLRTEAVVQIYQGHLTESADLSQKSLKVAREQRDPFLESSDLLNLGLVAIEMRHYDEALTLLSSAADSARPIQARVILEVALGNLGLAYLRLGDFEKALSNFQQAEKEGKEIGTVSLQVTWLKDACASHYMLGNLQEARTCYEQSLKAAMAIDAPKEIAEIQTELAFLFYRQGRFDMAKTDNEQAIRAARRAGDKSDELKTQYMDALLASRQENERNPERLLLQVSEHSAADPALQGDIDGALADFYAGRKQTKKADLWYRRSIRTFEEQRAAVADEELRLPFFANGDALYRRYADFLVASQKQDELCNFSISGGREHWRKV